jgi:hypothetical protein
MRRHIRRHGAARIAAAAEAIAAAAVAAENQGEYLAAQSPAALRTAR